MITDRLIAPSLKRVFMLCVLLVFAKNLFCQKYCFKNYTVINGLGSSGVNHIFEDSKGYIWFATQGGGASRFNGREFKNFTKTEGLVSNDVTFITEDRKGNIWIGTAQGASEFDGTSFKNFEQKEGLSKGIVYGIYADSDNRIWFAINGGGINIFDGAKFTTLTTKDGLPSNDVYSIIRDKSGYYWLGLSNGIAKYDGKQFTKYNDLKTANDKTFFSAVADDQGNIWFGSTSGDVVIIHPDKTAHMLQLPALLKSDFIGSIAQDKRGNTWFATEHGALKYHDHIFTLFTDKEGLSVNSVQSLMSDYEGNVWIGTLGGGVNLLSNEAFVDYTQKDGLKTNNVSCIYEDPDRQQYYVGTAGDGMYIFNPQANPKFKKVSGIRDILNINISSLSIDKTGLLRITAQEGVFVLKKAGNTFRLISKYEQVANQKILSPNQLIRDSKGNYLVAAYGSGVVEINDKGIKLYDTKNGLPSNNILAIFEDSRTGIWIGTQDAGVIRYDGRKFDIFNPAGGFPDKTVWSITGDGKGDVFFGTGESGLCCFDGKTLKKYGMADGLCSNYITSVEWDSVGNCLWLGSEKGINKIQFSGGIYISSLNTFNSSKGFNSFGVNQNAILADSKGLVWYGSVSGLWCYNRSLDVRAIIPPKIQLTGIRLAYQKVDWKKYDDSVDKSSGLPNHLTLSYKNNHLTFDLQALTTDNVLYTYKLDGQDTGWSPLTQNNEANYSNIPPGKNYVFKAKALNSSGVSSAEIISFPFTIKPPWWNTWRFRIASFLLAFGSIAAFIKVREGVLKEQNRKLEETVIHRTQEIEHQKKIVEEKNESITKQKEVVEETLAEKETLLHEKEVLLKEIHHRVKNNLQTISSMLMLQSAGLKDEQSKKAIIESQNRVRSIALVHQKLYQTDGLEKVEFGAFASGLTEQLSAVYYQQSGRVTIRCDIAPTYLLIDKAIPLGLILNELLTNSFKYAFIDNKPGFIELNLSHVNTLPGEGSADRKTVRLIYRDSGPGLPSADTLQNAATLGLRLIKLLSQQIGAQLLYRTMNGCEFIFTFALSVI